MLEVNKQIHANPIRTSVGWSARDLYGTKRKASSSESAIEKLVWEEKAEKEQRKDQERNETKMPSGREQLTAVTVDFEVQ
jgi:hypothetical protein